MNERLRAEDLWLRRAGAPVLRGASLSISQGETVVLVGPSGGGKSTILRALLGLAPLDRGRIWLRGALATDGGRNLLAPESRDIGMVFQDLALWPHFTVQRHLTFVLGSRGVHGAERAARVRAVIERFGLGGKEKRRPGELSGGEQQRLALARAVITNPDVLFLDEPLAHLDIVLRTELLEFLRELFAELGPAVLYVAHDPAEIEALGGRVVVMHAGTLLAAGPAVSSLRVDSDPSIRRFLKLLGVPPSAKH